MIMCVLSQINNNNNNNNNKVADVRECSRDVSVVPIVFLVSTFLSVQKLAKKS